MRDFDLEAARKAGYNDDEISDFLAEQSKFDIGAARKAGYTSAEILPFLNERLVKLRDAQNVANDPDYVPPIDPATEPTAARLRDNPPPDPAARPADAGVMWDGLTDQDRRNRRVQDVGFAQASREARARTEAAPSGTITPIKRSGLAQVGDTVRRGTQRAGQGFDALGAVAGTLPADAAGRRIAERQRRVEANAPPDDIQAEIEEITQAKTLGDAARALARNPRATLTLLGESVIASTPALATTIAGSIVGPGGTAAGAAIGSFATEYGASVVDYLTDKGMDARDPAVITRMLTDPQMRAEAKEYAAKRGVSVAAFDALSAGLAGRFIGPVLRDIDNGVAQGAVRRVLGASAAELALQSGAGVAGEGAAQLATGQYKPVDLILEGLAEGPSAIVEAGANVRGAMQPRVGDTAQREVTQRFRDTFRVSGLDQSVQAEQQQRTVDDAAILAAEKPADVVAAAATALSRPNVAADAIEGAMRQTPDSELLARVREQTQALQEQPPPTAPTITETQAPADAAGAGMSSPVNIPDIPNEPAGQVPSGPSAVDLAAAEAATSPANDRAEPTDGQKDAGNYKKGKVSISGLPVSIENEAGTSRRPEWPPLKDHYGYFRRTEGADGDHLDVFIKPGTPEDFKGTVFVVDQRDPKTGRFDEHKVVLGAADIEEAKALYRRNYEDGWQGLGAISAMPWEDFKLWAQAGNTKKPLAYRPTKEAPSEPTPAQATPVPATPASPAPAAAVGDVDVQRSAAPAADVQPGATARAAQTAGSDAGRGAVSDGPAGILPADRDSAAAPAVGPRTIGRLGKMPNTAVDVELRPGADGTLTVYSEGRELLDYDNGDPIRLPADVSDQDARDAIKRAGAVPAGARFFTPKEAQDLAPAKKDEGITSLRDARKALADIRVKIADQGRVVDDRLLTRERQLAAIVRELEQKEADAAKNDQGVDEPAAAARSAAGEPPAPAGEPAAAPAPAAADDAVRGAQGTDAPVAPKSDKARLIPTRGPDGRVQYAVEPVTETPAPAPAPNPVDAERERFREGQREIEDLSKTANAKWWNGDLTAAGRRQLLDAIGENRPAGVLWQYLPQDVRTRLVEANEAIDLTATPAQTGGQDARTLDQPSRPALEAAPAAPVRTPEAGGDAGDRTARGGRGDGQGNAGSPGERDAAGRGVDGGQEQVPVPARGAAPDGAGRADDGQPAARDDRREEPAAERDPAGRLTADGAPEAGAPAQPKPQNYTITDDDRLGEGGEVTKFEQNVAAIRLLKQLEAEDRPATQDEQRVLVKYVGWGGLKSAFRPKSGRAIAKGWEKRVEQLEQLLTPEEYAAANRSILDAHYTSVPVARAMWSLARRLGFNGGRVQETSMGIGTFFGTMPGDLRARSSLTGVELDSITARIAMKLYPRANILHSGYQDAKFADDTFDANLGNPPFGDQAIPYGDSKHLRGFSIHNYFFAKAIDKLAPGGIHVQVVSRYFMDSTDSRAREYIAKRAKLLGVIRLPRTAFKATAGTEVVTDIVVLQKLPRNQWDEASKLWVDSVPSDMMKDGEPIHINRWIQANKDYIAGKESQAGSMYSADEYTVEPDGDLEARLAEIIARFPEGVFQRLDNMGKPVGEQATEAFKEAMGLKVSDQVIEEASGRDIGALFTAGGKLYQRVQTDDASVRVREITASTPWSDKQTWGDARVDRAKRMGQLRDVTRRLLAAEAADLPKVQLGLLRQELNKQYDAFVKKHGFLNDRANEAAFRDDPDAPLVAALEADYDAGITPARAKTLGVDARKPSAKKMPIFERRVVEPYTPPTKADSTEDALAISLQEKGAVDLPYMARLLGKPEPEVAEALTAGEKPRAYLNPETNLVETAQQYLSGNVKAKYQQAMKAGLQKNAEALRAVFPPDLSSGDIRVRVGAPWVAAEDYEAFLRHIMGEGARAKVTYYAVTGQFAVATGGGVQANLSQKWGTPRRNADDIIDRLLNGKDMAVYDTDPDGKRILNKEQTDLANEKAGEVAREFEDWVFKDADRRERLVAYYNDHFNTNVEPKYDGTLLKLPGKVPDEVIKLRRHQLNAVWRVVQDGKALMDHVVGAGKTYTMIAAAMELRRMGLAKKPMVVVPNHLVEQWAADFYRLYPGAKLLAMRKSDFDAKNRQRMLARIATGDWDAVVIAHSSFGFIKNDRAVEEQFISAQIAEIQAAIDAARAAEGKKSRTERDFQKQLEKLEAKFKELTDKPKDDLLSFQELGVDALFVDEAHEFKNLFFTTQKRGVGGFGNPNGSKKAADLFMKARWLQTTRQGRGVVFATGTPVSNSLTELYTVQRYLGLDELESRGLRTLDAWLNSFGSIYSDYELDGSGVKYKRKERLRALTNVPEVIALYRQFADSVTLEDIQRNYREDNDGKELPVPKVKGGKRENVVVPRSLAQSAYFADIVKRASNIKPGGKDNMLAITTDARKAALDMRLVDPASSDEPGSKVHAAADRIAQVWRDNAERRGTQLVFLDMSVPLNQAGGMVAGGIRDALTLLGKQGDKALKQRLELLPPGRRWGAVKQMLLDEAASEDMAATDDGNDRADKAAEFLNGPGQELDAAVSALERRFSVYDDLRQKLIDRGVPAKEIAFIHDYDTDAKKSDLFDMVNAGVIRVLLGSTPKMGAGTNVQRKLVALHHLDCPWRPSDIEQREGRIIRQGNTFATPGTKEKPNPDYVPGFEVQIYAYATEQTYDARMWQVQEQKLIAINSLRNFTGERELEDVSSDAATAAEMKAAASGNPLILEDVQLTERIRKLEGLRRRHAAGQQDAESAVRRYERAIADLPAQIAALEKDAAKVRAFNADPFAGNPPRATVDGKAFTSRVEAERYVTGKLDALRAAAGEGKRPKWEITLDGKTFTNQEELTAALNEALGDLNAWAMTVDGRRYIRRGDAHEAMLKKVQATAEKPPARPKEIPLGEIAGLPVSAIVQARATARGETAEIAIVVGGEQDTSDSWFLAAGDTITQGLLATAVTQVARQKIAAESEAQRRLEDARKNLEPMREQLGQPFKYEDELKEKIERQREVKRLLSAEEKKDQPKATGTDDGEAMLDLSVPGFYSALERGVEGINAKAMTAGDWQVRIRSLVGKADVKADEIAWSGLEDWLAMQQGKVSKEAVLDYLRGNGVRVQEVTLGGPQKASIDEREQRAMELDGLSNGALAKIIYDTTGIDVQESEIDLSDPGERDDLIQAVIDAEGQGFARGMAPDSSDGPTKFGDYALPGGTNYREVLLTLPANALGQAPTDYSLRTRSGGYVGSFATADEAKAFREGRPDLYGSEVVRKVAGAPPQFRSTHWDQPNVLAHIRLNDRTDADGKRVLFVEEIQSDWAQRGRKAGFQQPAPAPVDKLPDGWTVKRSNGQLMMYDQNGEWAGGRTLQSWDTDADMMRKAVESYNQMQAARARGDGVPRAPFVESTDKWVALALKRILRMAAEGGYDRVAFVTGEQAADRFDLSKQVQEINWETKVLPSNEEMRRVYIRTNNDEVIRFHVMANTGKVSGGAAKEFIGKNLDEVVGKEIAKHILETQEDALRGMGLKLGGEGMRVFYDKIVPKVLADVAKKVGGGKVKQVPLAVPHQKDSGPYGFGEFNPADGRVIQRGNVFQVWVGPKGNEALRGGNFDTRAEAEAYLASGGLSSKAQPGIDITPAMRATIMGGLPLFSLGDRGQTPGNERTQDQAPTEAAPQTQGAAALGTLQTALRGSLGRPGLVLNPVAASDARLAGTSAQARAFRLAQAFAQRVFGVEVVIFEQRGNDVPFNGVVFSTIPNTIFLDIASNRPAWTLFGHELLHRLRVDRPDVYDALIAELKPLLSPEWRQRQQKLLDRYKQVGVKRLPSEDKLFEEFVADVVGDRFTEPAFWNQLADLNPSRFRRIADAVLRFIDELMLRLRLIAPDVYGTAAYISDLKRARQAIARALSIYAQGERQATDEAGLPAFDVSARTDTPAFRRWFRDSVVVDENGEPLVVYHGTKSNTDFATFNTPAHFGTAEQANAIAETFFRFAAPPEARGDSPRLMPVYLRIRNPIYMEDSGVQHGPIEYLEEVYNQGLIGRSVYESIRYDNDNNSRPDAEVMSLLIEELEQRGYDGFIYRNAIEGDGNSYVVFRPEQIKSAIGNRGTFDPNDGNMMFDMGGQRRRRGVEPTYEIPAETRVQAFERYIANNLNRLRTIQGAIREQGGRAEEFGPRDVYRAAERFPGIVTDRIDRFTREEVEPLFRAMDDAGVTPDELALYAYAKHAPERNAYIQQVNPRFAEEGGGSGMTDQDAAAIVERIDNEKPAVRELHQRLLGITRGTRDLLADEGLITPEQAEAWANQYEFYVPLKGFAAGELEDDGTRGTGAGFSIRGRESIQALGRASRAGQIIEHLLIDRERALIRAEKNRVGKALLDLATANPDPTLWEIDPVETRGRLATLTPRDDDGNVVGDPYREVIYESRPETGPQVFSTKVDGVEVRISLRDRQLAEAMKNLTDAQVGPVLRFMGQFNNMLSRLYTGLNPTFVVLNGFRDAVTGLIQAQQYDARLSGKILRYYPRALAAAARFEYDKVRHKDGQHANEWDRWFAEYSRNGGRTGFMALKSLEDKVSDVQRLFRRFDPNAPMSARTWARIMQAVEAIEGINQSVENATRLAAYRGARELGMTPAEAVSVAKNITVNFNRRGELTRWLAPFFLFFNAAVQGTVATGRALRSGRVQAAVGVMTGGAMAIALYGVAVGGDDEDGIAYWDKIPDHVKERNLVIMLPPGQWQKDGVEEVGTRGRYIKVPLPYGFNVFTVFGNSVVDALRNMKDPAAGKSAQRGAGTTAKAFIASYNPAGGDSPLTAVMPIAQPFFQGFFNVNRFGEPLYPTPQFGRMEARSEQYFENMRGSAFQRTASALNTLTGGNAVRDGLLSIQPAVLENTFRYFTGGLGQFGVDLTRPLLELQHTGTVDPTKLPFAKQLYGQVGEAESRRMYQDIRKDALRTMQEFKTLAEAGEPMDADAQQEMLLGLAQMDEALREALASLRRQELSVHMDSELSREQRRRELNQIEFERRYLYNEFLRTWKEGVREAAAPAPAAALQ